MTDTYWGIVQVQESPSLRARITACAAQEGIADPEPWVHETRWEWAAAPGWAAAYESALVSGNPDPGAAPDVITDGMILAQVQAMLAAAA